MKYISISVPVKPHIKKYIHALYGQVIVVSFKTFIGINIYSLLENKNFNKSRQGKRFMKVKAHLFTEKLSIRISEDLLYRTGLVIPIEKSAVINNMYEQMLSENLYTFCEAYKMAKIERQQAIEDFCKRYKIDIDVDITFDALSKTEYRHRKSKGQYFNYHKKVWAYCPSHNSNK